MRFLLVLLSVLSLGFSMAQLASGTNPEQVADDAVNAWLATKRPDIMALSSRPPEEICELLPSLVTNPPPPEGTTVNLADRRELNSDESSKTYSYPAALPGDQLEIVQVQLEKENNTWTATQVGYRLDVPQAGIRQWLQTAVASWLFVLFTAWIIYLVVRPSSFLRKWLAAGWQAIKEQRRTVIGTLIALYLIFGLGVITGANLPVSCEKAIQTVLEFAVGSVGATDAYNSLSLPRAAAVTFYQNFGVVTFSLIFGSSLVFGIPAYIFAAFSFYVQGIPFGLLLDANPFHLIFVILLLLIELTSYFLVVAGGGMLLMTLIRKGFGAFGEAIRKPALMLPFALLLLLFGAWYEAAVIILPQFFQ